MLIGAFGSVAIGIMAVGLVAILANHLLRLGY